MQPAFAAGVESEEESVHAAGFSACGRGRLGQSSTKFRAELLFTVPVRRKVHFRGALRGALGVVGVEPAPSRACTRTYSGAGHSSPVLAK